MYIKQMEVGLMQNFNYLIGDPETKECAYVDPAWETDRVLHQAKTDGYRVTQILLTHNHFDHTEGVDRVLQETSAKIYMHEDDQKPLVHNGFAIQSLKQGSEIRLGKLTIQVFSTPGHTPGSICYLVHDPQGSVDHLFTGDTLFQGNCGRSDLPGGNPKVLFKSLQFLKSLDPLTKVYPGHDYGSKPVSTIGYEKAHNPTLKTANFEEFDRLP